MLENPRFHSAETKAKIGLTQRRRYEERMKRQRIQEKYCLIWSHSIAESAKKGSQEQQELEWDGYEKLKTVLELDYWQRMAQEAWAKEYTKLKAVGAELAKAVRNRHTEKEKEKGEKAQLKKPRRPKKKSENSKEEEKAQLKKSKRLKKKSVDSKELSEIDCLKLKVRTMKQLMLPVLDLETVDCKTDMQKWDLKFIKQEKMRRRISFADQIKAAKGVRAISPAEEVRN